jgi:hypothetical protein
VILLERDKAISWGFGVGQVTTKSVLRINESGEWTEVTEIKIDSELPKRLLEITVRLSELSQGPYQELVVFSFGLQFLLLLLLLLLLLHLLQLLLQ